MPAGVFLVGDDDEANGIKSRVRRLVDLATSGRQPQLQGSFLANPMTWGLTVFSLITIASLSHSQSILANVHVLIEQAVYFLK
jgi:hypothetical protein